MRTWRWSCAEIDGSIVGYLCGSSVEFNRRFALLAAMIERYPHTQMHGRSLDSYESFVYGPVCVDRRFRGRGVLRGLYRELRVEVTGEFDIGVAFVAQDNAHSLSAHVQGLGMFDVGRFEFDARAYRISHSMSRRKCDGHLPDATRESISDRSKRWSALPHSSTVRCLRHRSMRGRCCVKRSARKCGPA